MIVHILFILIILFYCSQSRKAQGRGLAIISILLFFIIGLRDYSVGTDTISYIEEYRATKIGSPDVWEGFEPGRRNFLLFCKYLGLNSRGYLLLVSSIIVIPMYLIAKRWTPWPSLAMFLYVTIGNYTFNLTGIRQSIAIGIVMFGLYLALKQLSTKKKIIYLSLFVFLASTIHYTALFCFIMVPLIVIGGLKKKAVFIMVCIPPLTLALKPFIFNYVSFFSTINKYEHYFTEEQSDPNIVAYFFIPYVIYLFSTWLYLRYLNILSTIENKHKPTVFFYLCAFMCALVGGLSMSFPIIARASYYFSFFSWIFLSQMLFLQKRNNSTIRLSVAGAIIVCVLFFLISVPHGILGVGDYSFSFK